MPNESNHNAYLLPVDVDGAQTELCLPISKLYQELNDLKANHTVVFMDACFSGAQRGNGMLTNARSVALKVKMTHHKAIWSYSQLQQAIKQPFHT